MNGGYIMIDFSDAVSYDDHGHYTIPGITSKLEYAEKTGKPIIVQGKGDFKVPLGAPSFTHKESNGFYEIFAVNFRSGTTNPSKPDIGYIVVGDGTKESYPRDVFIGLYYA